MTYSNFITLNSDASGAITEYSADSVKITAIEPASMSGKVILETIDFAPNDEDGEGIYFWCSDTNFASVTKVHVETVNLNADGYLLTGDINGDYDCVIRSDDSLMIITIYGTAQDGSHFIAYFTNSECE